MKSEIITDENASCPVCGGHTFMKESGDGTVLGCTSCLGENKYALRVALCRKCGVYRDVRAYTVREDGYACPECGEVSPSLTEHMRSRQDFRAKCLETMEQFRRTAAEWEKDDYLSRCAYIPRECAACEETLADIFSD